MPSTLQGIVFEVIMVQTKSLVFWQRNIYSELHVSILFTSSFEKVTRKFNTLYYP